MKNTIEYTNKRGVELTIKKIENHSWYGEMTGWHEKKYAEYVVWQGKHVLGDGFGTLEDAKVWADTIEF